MKTIGFFIFVFVLLSDALFSQNEPDRGQYRMIITPKSVYNWGNGDACSGSYFSIRAKYSGQTGEKEIPDSNTPLSIDSKRAKTDFSPIPPVLFSVDNRIEKLIFHAKRKQREWGKCVNFREGDNAITLYSGDYPCLNKDISRGDNGEDILDGDGSYYGVFNVRISPLKVRLFFQDTDLAEGDRGDSYVLPSGRSVKIKATTGFPREVYQWQYRKGSGDWQDIPDQFISPDGMEVSFYGKDLLDIREIYDKVPLSVAIRSSCIDSENTIELQPRPSAPTYLRTDSIIGEQCVNSKDGKLYFTLSRDLLENEYIWAESVRKDGSNNVLPLSVEKIAANQYLIYGLAPGDYTFGITGYYIDQYNHEVSIDVVGDGYHFEGFVPAADPLNFNIEEVRPVICAQGNEGGITVKAWGGSGTYRIVCKNRDGSVFRSDFDNSELLTISGLQSGEYEVWIEDSNGCSLEDFPDELTIGEPEDPFRMDQVELFRPVAGSSDGSVEVRVAKGEAPFEAIWRYGDSSGDLIPSGKIKSLGDNGIISRLEGVPGGSYHVTFIDGQGCHVEKTITIEELPPFEIRLAENRTIHCYGESTGELEVNVSSGGLPPYNYQWYRLEDPYRYPVGTGNVLSGIPAGHYQAKITDSAGNEIWTSLIEQTQGIPVNVSFQTEMLLCHGGHDGFLEASLSGGSEPYSYRWITGNSDHTGLRIGNLAAGDYGLEVTDGNGCLQVVYGTVSEPESLSLSAQITDPSCSDLSDGTIRLMIQGGTQPYDIQWTTGNYTDYAGNLAAGTYQVSVTDRYTCGTVNGEYTLVEPEPLLLSRKQIKPVSAFGERNGSAAFYIEGGTPSYQIVCKNGNGSINLSRTINNPGQVPVVAEFNSLPEGDYIVTVTDSKFNSGYPHNCIIMDTFAITQPPLLQVDVEESHFITCYKGNDGQLTAHASGGVPLDSVYPYSYKWYRIETDNKVLIQEGDSILNDLPYGQYQVEIIDQNGVFALSAPYILQYLSPVKIEFTAAVLRCSSDREGWARAKVTGGTGTYQYLWSTGDTLASIENVRGGKYQLTVTDARGCEVSGEVRITSPNPLSFDHEIQTPLCAGRNDGSISLNVRGGTAPYNYQWSDESRESYLKNLYQGEYQVKITDAHGCLEDTVFTLSEPDPVWVEEKELIPPRAYGYSDGSLSVQVSGGTRPYQLFWTDERGNSVPGSVEENEEGQVIASIRNLSKGTYSLRVEDVNYPFVYQEDCACLHTTSFFIPEPPLLEVEIEISRKIRCFGTNDGEIVAHAKGGVSFAEGLPYVYQWHKDGQLLSVNDSVINQLGPGEYKVRITDANEIEVYSESVFLSQPDPLKLELSAADLRCSRDVNGWVEVKTTGGTAPYVHHWSTGDTTSRVEKIPRGKYFVFVTDGHGCTITGNTEIIQPGGIKVQTEMIEPTCYHGSDGSIRLHISGGEAPYRYEWDNGDRSLSHSGLMAGKHTVTITDINECSHEVLTYDLGQPDSIIIDLGRNWELCKDQTLDLNASISESARSYVWFGPSGQQLASGSFITLKDPGAYRVEVLTTKGCKGTGEITITHDDRVIAADFVVASKVPIRDEVLIVDISDPEPDRIEWIFPDETGSFEVLDADSHFLSLVFNDYGEYRVGMKTYSGKCEKAIYKTIQVVNKEDIENYEDADEPMLRQFVVSPNPNKGDFNLTLELKESSPVVLQLVNSGTGQVVEKRYLQGARIYNEQFHLHGAEKGTFVLNLFSPKVKSVEKIIVH